VSGLQLHWPTWIGVVSDDLEAQRRFYRDVLGLRELESGDDWVQFDFEGNVFELVERSDVPQYRQRYQVGFTVDDIRVARTQLIDRGVEAISEIEGDPDAGGAWCYFRDPEGNVFELTQRER
jgi:catechol 2,3-dioxygenase-like lactoylglutathione lyase family enzyme